MKDFEPTEDTISLHGLGFIQVKLGGNQRLHVWHPDLPRRSCFEHSAIHDHRFSFTSRVLVGEMFNIDYFAAPYGKRTHTAYLHEGPRAAHGGRPWIPDGEVNLQGIRCKEVQAGCEYEIEAYELHRTEPGGDGRVATLMTKTWEGERGAHSFCRIGVEPDAAFDRKQLSAASLWEYVTEVLGSVK